MQYFLAVNNQRLGPMEESQLLGAGMQPQSLVWFEGSPSWVPAHQVPQLQKYFRSPASNPGYQVGVPSVPRPAAPPDYSPSPAMNPNYGDPYNPAHFQPYHRFDYAPFQFSTLYGWWLGIYIAFFVSTIGMVILSLAFDRGRNPDLAGPVLISFLLFTGLAITMTVLSCILLYRCWHQIQDGKARTTPGAAVGLLFVPFYNLYWLFQAYYGLAVDQNSFLNRHRIRSPKASEGLALATCILTIIPYLNLISGLILFPMMMFNLKTVASFIARQDEKWSE